MRIFPSLLLPIVAFGFAAAPARAASTPAPTAAVQSSDVNASCRIPFEQLRDSKTGEFFPLSAALNENDKLPGHYRQRYVVADLNSADADGYCRGVQEYFSPVSELTEFPRLRAIALTRNVDVMALAKESPATLLAAGATPDDAAALKIELEDLQNYVQQVQRFKADPIVKPAVFNGYCVGQTLSFCEIVNGEPKLVYRFVTSSSRGIPPLNRYYAPINVIRSRSWSTDRPYTPADARRDARLGGGDARAVPFQNGGNPIEMPNFMHFVPDKGYVGETGNGIHQIAGGLDSGGTFGSPVSLGCIRLNKFQAKLARWWTPRQAKFFIYFEPNRYRHFGDPKTAKAKGQQYLGPVSTASATRPDTQRRNPTFAGTSLMQW